VKAIAPEVRDRGDAHILIVDNGSGDGSAAYIEQAIGTTSLGDCASLLALDDNRGFAAGNNAGLEYYRALAGHWPIYSWLLNPDTIAEPGALGALIDGLAERPCAGLAGGRCLRKDGTVRHSAFRFHTALSEFIAALDFGPLRGLLARYDVVLPVCDAPFRAEWLSGSHLLIRGDVFDRVGLLDPSYFLYFEETDFCARAAVAGFEAWHIPASRIVHLGGQSTGLIEHRPPQPRPRYWFESRARFLLRRHGLAQTHLANLLWLLATPPGALIARLRGRRNERAPHLWRDFLLHYYGPGGLMYRPREWVT
jgi:GT2 family glycosyltransferase